MSALWSVEYQRKDSDTKECLWVSVAEPKSMARADLKAARVNAQRLARARLEHKVGKVVILSCRCIRRDWLCRDAIGPARAARHGTIFIDRLPMVAEAVGSPPGQSGSRHRHHGRRRSSASASSRC